MTREMVIEIDKRDLKTIRRALDRAVPAAGAAIGEIVEAVATEARERAQPHAADKGDLAATIKTDLSAGAFPLGGKVFTTTPIARTVEEGRAAGKPPPYARIAKWMAAHGFTEPVALVVQRIRRSGTKGVKFMAGAAEHVRKNQAPEILRDAAREIERQWRRSA